MDRRRSIPAESLVNTEAMPMMTKHVHSRQDEYCSISGIWMEIFILFLSLLDNRDQIEQRNAVGILDSEGKYAHSVYFYMILV